jgi:hypothetical protein
VTNLPIPASGAGNGTNSITSGTYAALPSFPASTSIENPDSTLSMLVLCNWGVWLRSDGATTYVEACPALSGATTIPAGVGGGGPISMGEIPYTNLMNFGSPNLWRSFSGVCTYALPPGVTTFTMQAKRTGAAAAYCDYAAIHVTPLRFQ